jgi:hypothetical protein
MVQGRGGQMRSVIVNDVVVEMPVLGREADTAPTPAHQQIHRHYHLLQPIHKNHLPPQSNCSPLLDLHTTDMMFLARAAAIAMPTMSNLALLLIGDVGNCSAISRNYAKLRTWTES